MKKIRLLTLLWVILFAGTLAGCWNSGQSDNNSWDVVVEDVTWEVDEVINYNDKLVELASQCIISENDVLSVYDNSSSIEEVQEAINNTIAKCTNIGEEINKLWDWKWDSLLKNWVLDVIEKEIAYYTKFSEIIPYMGKEEVSEEEKVKYESLLSEIESLDEELNESNNNLMSIQEQFAKKYGYELEGDATYDDNIIWEEGDELSNDEVSVEETEE